MIQYLQNPWISGVISILATSLAVTIANRFDALKKIHNGVIVLIAAAFFTLLTTPFGKISSVADVQVLALRFALVLMIAFSVAVTSAQAIVDFLIQKVIDKLKDFMDKFTPKPPPAMP